MRYLFFVLVLALFGIVALSTWRPGATLLPSATPPSPTLLPEGFTLIPTFTPSFPCELQNVDVYDDRLCRNESVHESILTQGEHVMFLQHDYHMGQGCWDSISQDVHELHVCAQGSGAVTILTRNLVTSLMPSPDSEWLAFGTMNPLSTEGDALRPHLFRVRRDGTGLQQLDTQGFPDYAVGAPRDLRWLDDQWLAFSLWDGTGEEGWHPYRLKSDGSGVSQPFCDCATELP